jgi:hypothetical protein
MGIYKSEVMKDSWNTSDTKYYGGKNTLIVVEQNVYKKGHTLATNFE